MIEYTDEQLRMLVAQATPGPWEAEGRVVEQKYWNKGFPEDPVSCEVECSAYCYGGTGRGVGRPEDAAFIAACREWVPDALRRLDNARVIARKLLEASGAYSTLDATPEFPEAYQLAQDLYEALDKLEHLDAPNGDDR